MLAVLHVAAGIGAGSALSFTHGCIGRSQNPHRLFAVANVALGVFAVFFFGGVPQLILKAGAQSFFWVCTALMLIGALVTALGFPTIAGESAASQAIQTAEQRHQPIHSAAWIIAGVVVCLTLNQAMVFSFVERIGADRGFGPERVQGVLIALGLVNLTPGALAALLQKRISPLVVGMLGPIGQALLALTIANTSGFAPFAVAACFYTFMVIFTHAFLFGLLARIDPTGRAVAATPAMMMIGSCIGPALAGGLVHGIGYVALGWAATAVSVVALIAMTQVKRLLPPDVPAASAAESTLVKGA